MSNFLDTVDLGETQAPQTGNFLDTVDTGDTGTQTPAPIQKPTEYNQSTNFDTKDLGNALSVGKNIDAVGHTLSGLIGLGGDILGGGVNFLKNVVTVNGDAIGEQAKTLGTNVSNLAGNLLNEGAGAVEGTLSTLGAGNIVNKLDPEAEKRVSLLKERLSTDGALGVALDLFPMGKALGMGGKLSKIKSAISDGAKAGDLAEASYARTGADVAKTAIDQNLAKLVDPATETGGMLSKFTQSLLNNPIINNKLTRSIINPSKGISEATGALASGAVDMAKSQNPLSDAMKAGEQVMSKEDVSKALSSVIKNSDTSSAVSNTLSDFHANVDKSLQDSRARYKELDSNTKKVELNKPPVLEHTENGLQIKEAETIKGNAILSKLQKDGLKAKLIVNENGVPQIKGFSALHENTGLSSAEMSQLAQALNKAGILSSKMSPSQFVSARRAIGDVAFSNKTGALVDKLKSIRADMNEAYRPKIDSITKENPLSAIDKIHEGTIDNYKQLIADKVLSKDGAVHPTFAKKLTQLTKNGTLENVETQAQLESMAKSLGTDTETLRKQLVWDSFTDELKGVISKQVKTSFSESILSSGGVLGVLTGQLHFGIPAFGAAFLMHLMKSPETFVQVLKLGQKVIDKRDAITSYTVDNSVAKLKNGIALTPEQTELVQRLTKKAFSQLPEIGYATLNMLANKKATGENTPSPFNYVEPTQQQNDMSSFLMNR